MNIDTEFPKDQSKELMMIPVALVAAVANALGTPPLSEHDALRTRLLNALQEHHSKTSVHPDSVLLDHLDSLCTPVAERQDFYNPAGEHIANSWSIQGPEADVRSALLYHMRNPT